MTVSDLARIVRRYCIRVAVRRGVIYEAKRIARHRRREERQRSLLDKTFGQLGALLQKCVGSCLLAVVRFLEKELVTLIVRVRVLHLALPRLQQFACGSLCDPILAQACPWSSNQILQPLHLHPRDRTFYSGGCCPVGCVWLCAWGLTTV